MDTLLAAVVVRGMPGMHEQGLHDLERVEKLCNRAGSG